MELTNLFTGWKTSTSPRRRQGSAPPQAQGAGHPLDGRYTRRSRRAQRTLDLVLEERARAAFRYQELASTSVITATSPLNKDDARKKWGEQQVQLWRAPMMYRRLAREPQGHRGARVAYYIQEILRGCARRELLVAAHGNSLRPLVMVLERLDTKQILSAGSSQARIDLPFERCIEVEISIWCVRETIALIDQIIGSKSNLFVRA